MICKNCGKEFEGNFCPECGTKIEDASQQEVSICPNCGAERVDNGKFCVNCGFDYSEPSKNVDNVVYKVSHFSNRGNNFVKAFAKAYRWILACGMLFIGAVALLCLLSPTIVEEVLGHINNHITGYTAIFNSKKADVKEVTVYASIILFSVALLSVIYGMIQLILAIKKPYRNIKNLFLWILDGVISLSLIVVGIMVSTDAKSGDYWGGKLGAGFAMCVTMGVFGLIFLAARIFYELKVFKIEDAGLKEEEITSFNSSEHKDKNKKKHNNAEGKQDCKSSNKNRKKITAIVVSCLIMILILGGTLMLTLYPFPEVWEDGICYRKFNSYYEARQHSDNIETLIIASSVRGVPVKAVDDWSFNGNTTLERVVLPDSVTLIDSGAFSGCINLMDINITRHVKEIGSSAFENCESLLSLYIPLNVEVIGAYAFTGCKYIIIYCEASSKPSGWDENWNYLGGEVRWGQRESDVI